MQECKLFKTKNPTHQVEFPSGTAVFYRGRFATVDKELEGEIERMTGNAKENTAKIYIDPNEPTVTVDVNSKTKLREQVARDFLLSRTATQDMGSNHRASGVNASNTQDNPAVGGTGALAPQFSVVESRAAMSALQAETGTIPQTAGPNALQQMLANRLAEAGQAKAAEPPTK